MSINFSSSYLTRRDLLAFGMRLAGATALLAACRRATDRAPLAAPSLATTPNPANMSISGPMPTPVLISGSVHAKGGRLLDGNGNEVRITGVNWFGMETGSFAPHGLWARSGTDMLDEVVAAGFNAIRLPFSNELFEPGRMPNGIDFEQNPELRGLSGIEILDWVIDEAGRRGLKVILDRHRPTSDAQAELWYTDRVPEERWVSDWVMLAKRYRGNPAVLGADLHNEPHGPATWGDGNPKTDWRLAAERAGNAILAANPDWLIIVEGVESYGGEWYWWGGNLSGAQQHPVRLDDPSKLVYSAHDYGPGVWQQSWFTDPRFPENLPELWQKRWAYLSIDGIAPVLIGEFGGRSVDPSEPEGIWQRTLVDYLKATGISYTYWSWNPNSGDTGGILLDDWRTIDKAKLALLQSYQWPLIA